MFERDILIVAVTVPEISKILRNEVGQASGSINVTLLADCCEVF